jgi:hypothetical protein
MPMNAINALDTTYTLPITIGTYIAWGLALFLIAKKTDTANAWFAWVPILNILLMLDIAGMDWWWMLLLFVPCVNVIVSIYVWWQICEERNKPGALGLLMLIPLVNLLVALYLGLSD